MKVATIQDSTGKVWGVYDSEATALGTLHNTHCTLGVDFTIITKNGDLYFSVPDVPEHNFKGDTFCVKVFDLMTEPDHL